MSDHDQNPDMIASPPRTRRSRRFGWAAALLAGAALAGAVLAANLPASAGDTTPNPSSSSGVAGTESRDLHRDNGGDFRHRESALTGATATKVKAAALKKVPGATVDRLERDADGAIYEAHLTKPDGSQVTVKLNARFAVTGVETGGPGEHGPGAREHA